MPKSTFSAFPSLNTGAVLTFIYIFAPVYGFLPFLAFFFLAPKVPKPIRVTSSFFLALWQ
jgi:hypothetical protein